MAKIENLRVNFDCRKIKIEESDYKNTDSRILVNMAFEIFLIREFENTLLKLWSDGCVNGPVHTSIGQEACAAGAMAAIKTTDKIASTHRAHHHYLAKAISFYSAKGINLATDQTPEKIQKEVTTLMGEVMGLSIGCCGGRGGSMHLRNAQIGVVGTNAIVSGGVPFAAGAAFAEKYLKSDNIIVCFLGDGAVNQGSFHEAINLAAIWKLPVIYFIENNLYAVATAITKATAVEDLAIKAGAYGISGRIVDGMNPLAVMLATQEAAQYVRSGNGAMIVEAKCYRFPHHAGPLAGSKYGYRQKQEEDIWLKRDPHTAFGEELVSRNILSKKQLEEIRDKAISVVHNSLNQCTIKKNDKFFVRENLCPDTKTIEVGLRSDGSEFNGTTFSEKDDFSEFETKSYVEAIAAVTGRHLEKDDRVFVLGEEVASFDGGPYAATKPLPAKYPQRILNTPISEAGFSGLAGGAAACGLRPIVEIMFPDFSLVAADQLFNQLGRLRHMYGNTLEMPIVVRTRVAIGCGYGGQHSMDPAGLFTLFSGWHVAAPSNAFDYIGLFNSAMRCKDPVLIIEHHTLYPVKFEVPKGNLDYFIQMGKAKVVRQGENATILCYSSTVPLALQAAAELEAEDINVEVIDLRMISHADIDYETIGQSLEKSGKLITVEQAPASMSVGPYIISECQKRFFDSLDGPALSISGADIPLSVSKVLEAAAIPCVKSVKEKIRKAIKG